MKKLITFFAIIISLNVSAQKSTSKLTTSLGILDSTEIKKKDSAASVLMNDFLVFLQDKITVKNYLPVQEYVNEFLKSKEYLKPKK